MSFKVDDRVCSAPNSSDVTMMDGIWHATVISVREANVAGGFVYETLGTWEWPNGKPTWASDNFDKEPTLRQLWDEHLVKDRTRRINKTHG